MTESLYEVFKLINEKRNEAIRKSAFCNPSGLMGNQQPLTSKKEK